MNSMMTTIKKEIRSMLRDRKTLLTLFVFPLFIPFMIFLYAYMFDNMEDTTYMIGVNYEMNSIESSLVDEANLEVKYYEDITKLEDAYDNGEIYGYIDYNKNDNCYSIYTNSDSSDGMSVNSYINAYLKGYNDYLKELYLIGEDIDIDKANNNFLIKEIKLEGENYLLEMVFTVAFTYIIMAIVMSSTNMATSATAVEKENGTMETLLTFPIKIKDLVMGKYLAATIIGFISSLVGLVLTIISLVIATSNFESFKDLEFMIGIKEIGLGIVIISLASMLIAGVSILLTSRAKSFKEAQSVSSMFSLIILIPMMISMMNIKVDAVYYLIPILNYTQILMDIFSGIISISNIFLVIISSLVSISLVIYLVIKRYKVEEVLF